MIYTTTEIKFQKYASPPDIRTEFPMDQEWSSPPSGVIRVKFYAQTKIEVALICSGGKFHWANKITQTSHFFQGVPLSIRRMAGWILVPNKITLYVCHIIYRLPFAPLLAHTNIQGRDLNSRVDTSHISVRAASKIPPGSSSQVLVLSEQLCLVADLCSSIKDVKVWQFWRFLPRLHLASM
jgi:hypothetical protein